MFMGEFDVMLYSRDLGKSLSFYRDTVGVENVDALHVAVTGRGVEAKPPTDSPWGWRMFFVRDPDGHVLGFCQPL